MIAESPLVVQTKEGVSILNAFLLLSPAFP